MKELKIFGVIVFFTLFTYWGVEPYAHSIFHPHVEPADFEFTDLPKVEATGDVANGKAQVEMNCVACHGIESEGINAPLDNQTANMSYGVVPPDLSLAGKIYNANFLANFIKNPEVATKTAHKFSEAGKVHPMPGYAWMSDSDIASIVAYLQDVANRKVEKDGLTDKEVFENACGRCHNMKYAKIEATSDVSNYMGSTPPDLSVMIISRGHHYLETFINDPQKHLHGTAMPRVGLTEEAQAQVIAYMEATGDSKKEEREALAPLVLGFLAIMAVLSYFWKKEVWDEVK
ncbi:Ubiquinol - cytochrome c reductase (c subunit of the bc complex) [Thiovulum sp. ES]|nr:Ubiquinol - cytochrome c reductase (c subunit of the bc complex) [Thiovulum sp. ES]